MSVLALIGARSGSVGVPDKNIRVLAGHPLLAFSIKAALKVPGIDRVIVATDSTEHARIAACYGAEAPFILPASLTAHDSTDYDWISYFLDCIQRNGESPLPELIVHLRPTTPLRNPQTIVDALEWFNLRPMCSALRSVQEMSETAYKCFELDDAEILKHSYSGSYHLDDANKPRQAFPRTFYGNGYVDILRTQFILSHRKLHGHRCFAYVTKPTVEIDTEADFEYAEYLAQRNPELVGSLFG